LGQLILGHQDTPSPLTQIGIKGAGEAGVIPVSAVLASAVGDAVGVPITAMPLDPSTLFELRRGRSADSSSPPTRPDAEGVSR